MTRYDGHLVFAWEAWAEPPLARTGTCGCQEGTRKPDTAQAAEGKGALLLTWKELHDDSLHALDEREWRAHILDNDHLLRHLQPHQVGLHRQHRVPALRGPQDVRRR